MRENEFPILLQEFIPGPPTATYFLDGFRDQHGTTCGMLARQRLRMFPADLGNSTLFITVPRTEVKAAEQSLRDLLEWVAYRGVFSAEFKYDHRDGQFKLLEINARPWWYVEFAAHCGMDVCAMAYHDALDLPVEPTMEYEVGRSCVYLVNDLRALWGQKHPGLWSWMRSWLSAEGTPFHWNDPGPALAFPACALRNRRGHSARRKPGI
jgi:predicted ATP-grasp superfamily ATP-dependent carboligase